MLMIELDACIKLHNGPDDKRCTLLIDLHTFFCSYKQLHDDSITSIMLLICVAILDVIASVW